MAASGTITHYLTIRSNEYLKDTGVANIDLASLDFQKGLFPYARDKLRRQKNWRTVDLTGKHLALFSAIRDPNRRPNECFLCSKSQNLDGWHAFDSMPVIPAPPTPLAPTISQVEGPDLPTDVTRKALNAAGMLTDEVVHPVGTCQAANDVIVDTLPVIKQVVTAPIQVAQEATSDISATTARLGGLRISSGEPWAFMDDLAEDPGTEDPIDSDEEEEEQVPKSITGLGKDLQILYTELIKVFDRGVGELKRDMGAMLKYVGHEPVLAHVKKIFNIDETTSVEGIKLPGVEFTKEGKNVHLY
ncbi:hypothetical protein SpCBS45565_g01880 [Spizellomyces sp. 'palustris']|nr:hypothetical protein SpCBS45565_g01880 [Spizellomyces sp. 'palustris']